MGPISESKYKQFEQAVARQIELNKCKHCERRDPNVPTTLEMDGLHEEKHIKDRFFVMVPCLDCAQYNKQDTRIKFKDCSYCGSANYAKASTYWSSIRTWNSKKKITPAERKKMGA